MYWLLLFIAAFPSGSNAELFRTLAVETSHPGNIRMVNTMFYSKIPVNETLVTDYAVEQPRVLTNIATLELGMSRNLAVTIAIPYCADLYTQRNKRGYKGGVGDIVAGLRIAVAGNGGNESRFGFGARILIPEQIGFGSEPLGFRRFSNGEFGYALESAARLRKGFTHWYAAASLYRFPGAPEAAGENPHEIFYDTEFGYRGIGKPDPAGFAPPLFIDQLHMSAGGAIPLRRGISGFLELHAAAFLENPKRGAIMRLTPGVRLGSPESVNAALGLDIRLSGPVPHAALIMKCSIPSFSPREIRKASGQEKRASNDEQNRSRNAMVAVREFSGSGATLFDDRNLRTACVNALGSLEIMNMIPEERVDVALIQEKLAPAKDSPQHFGMRIGANFVIDAEIISYRAERKSRFSIPYLIRFPANDFSLSVRANVLNLASGKTHDLGIVSAAITKKRGVLFFPGDLSSDLRYFSEPETRIFERELSDRWVDAFKIRVMERIDLFEWEPKRALRNPSESGG